MKAVHSFKSARFKPMLESIGGTYIIKPMVQIMALSAASIRKHHPDFVLITDEAGKALAEACKMPYSEIISVGDKFDSHPNFWIHSKLHAYHELNEPFVHYDNDVFLWEPLPERLLAADVFGFHSETFVWRKYEAYGKALEDSGIPIPKLHRKYWTSRMPVNMAIFGGNNHAAIKQYAGFVLEWLQDNQGFWNMDDKQAQALDENIAFIEQLWVSYLIQDAQGIPIELLLTEQQVQANEKVDGVQLTHLHGAKQAAMRQGKTHELVAKLDAKLKEVNPEVHAAVQEFTSPDVDIAALIKESQDGQNSQ